MKSEDEWKPAAGANAPAAGFLYDRRQSRARLLGVLVRYADSVEGAPARDLALRVMRLIENTD